MSSSSSSSNPLLLAAEGGPALLTYLRAHPETAPIQDAAGYSLMHALSSYNHVQLLTEVVDEFGLDVNVRDEDGETALFVAETVEMAQLLVERLHVDPTLRNHEDQTAEEAIWENGDFAIVAEWLRERRTRGQHMQTEATTSTLNQSTSAPSTSTQSTSAPSTDTVEPAGNTTKASEATLETESSPAVQPTQQSQTSHQNAAAAQISDPQVSSAAQTLNIQDLDSPIQTHPPPIPEGLKVTYGSMETPDDDPVDDDFRARIEALAARPDFAGEHTQRELRDLITDAVRDVGLDDRSTRPRLDS